jgi:hypothetical protein
VKSAKSPLLFELLDFRTTVTDDFANPSAAAGWRTLPHHPIKAVEFTGAGPIGF